MKQKSVWKKMITQTFSLDSGSGRRHWALYVVLRTNSKVNIARRHFEMIQRGLIIAPTATDSTEQQRFPNKNLIVRIWIKNDSYWKKILELNFFMSKGAGSGISCPKHYETSELTSPAKNDCNLYFVTKKLRNPAVTKRGSLLARSMARILLFSQIMFLLLWRSLQ